MSEREFQGYVTIRQQSDHSMFTLRASLASSKVKAALKTCLNVAVPKRGTYAQTGETLLAWMSPDELLIMVPKDAGGAAFAALEQALDGLHYLLADVSDARSPLHHRRRFGPRSGGQIGAHGCLSGAVWRGQFCPHPLCPSRWCDFRGARGPVEPNLFPISARLCVRAFVRRLPSQGRK